MQVRIFRRRYSSSRSPYARLWIARTLLLKPSTNGLVHRDLSGITAIGVDAERSRCIREVQWQRGHHYLTVVYQLDAGRRRLLWVGRERTVRTRC